MRGGAKRVALCAWSGWALSPKLAPFESPLCSSLSHKLTLTAERTDGVGSRGRDEVSRSLARKASSRGHGALSRGVRTPRGS